MMQRKGIMIGLGVLGATTWVFLQMMFPDTVGFESGFLVIITTVVGIAFAAFYKRNQKPSPKSILRGRYARGEITKEEYDQMKEKLD